MSPRGTYALLLHLSVPRHVVVGALGAFNFPSGWYLYLGSARGPGGLAARLARHRRREKERHHWHIDYLRAVATLVEVWSSTGAAQRECGWAAAAAALSTASIIAPRFGASDCQCASHLYHFSLRPEPGQFEALVQTELIRERLEEQKRHIGQGA